MSECITSARAALQALVERAFRQGKVSAGAARDAASPLCCVIAACLVASPVGAESHYALGAPKLAHAVADERPVAGAGLGMPEQVELSPEGLALLAAIANLKSDMAADMAELRSDMADLRTEVKLDMADLRMEVKLDIANLRTEVKSDMAELRSDMVNLRADVKSDFAKSESGFVWRWVTLGIALAAFIMVTVAAMTVVGTVRGWWDEPKKPVRS